MYRFCKAHFICKTYLCSSTVSLQQRTHHKDPIRPCPMLFSVQFISNYKTLLQLIQLQWAKPPKTKQVFGAGYCNMHNILSGMFSNCNKTCKATSIIESHSLILFPTIQFQLNWTSIFLDGKWQRCYRFKPGLNLHVSNSVFPHFFLLFENWLCITVATAYLTENKMSLETYNLPFISLSPQISHLFLCLVFHISCWASDRMNKRKGGCLPAVVFNMLYA